MPCPRTCEATEEPAGRFLQRGTRRAARSLAAGSEALTLASQDETWCRLQSEHTGPAPPRAYLLHEAHPGFDAVARTRPLAAASLPARLGGGVERITAPGRRPMMARTYLGPVGVQKRLEGARCSLAVRLRKFSVAGTAKKLIGRHNTRVLQLGAILGHHLRCGVAFVR